MIATIKVKTLAYIAIVEAFGTPLARLRRVSLSCSGEATVDPEAKLLLIRLRIIVLLPPVLLQGRLPYFVFLLA
jgi:hypothetical protein